MSFFAMVIEPGKGKVESFDVVTPEIPDVLRPVVQKGPELQMSEADEIIEKYKEVEEAFHESDRLLKCVLGPHYLDMTDQEIKDSDEFYFADAKEAQKFKTFLVENNQQYVRAWRFKYDDEPS